MPKYQVTAWQDVTHSGVLEIEANSAADALEEARQLFEDGDGDCEETGNSESIHCMEAEPVEVLDDMPADKASWQDPNNFDRAKMGDAARAMLAALQKVTALPGAAVDCQRAGVLDEINAAIAVAIAAGLTVEGDRT